MRTPESLQVIWQKKFQEYQLNPFVSLTKESGGLRFQQIDNPAFWWHNPVNPDSLRLTKPAFNTLNKANVPNWKFKLDQVYLPKTYLQMEKYFTAPYYVHGAQNIYVYGETEAIMLGLHGNNLQQYLDNHDTHA